MDRIDKIEIRITGYASFEGSQHTVTITKDIADQNDWLVLAVRRAWQEYYDKLVSSMAGTISDPTILL